MLQVSPSSLSNPVTFPTSISNVKTSASLLFVSLLLSQLPDHTQAQQPSLNCHEICSLRFPNNQEAYKQCIITCIMNNMLVSAVNFFSSWISKGS